MSDIYRLSYHAEVEIILSVSGHDEHPVPTARPGALPGKLENANARMELSPATPTVGAVLNEMVRKVDAELLEQQRVHHQGHVGRENEGTVLRVGIPTPPEVNLFWMVLFAIFLSGIRCGRVIAEYFISLCRHKSFTNISV